MIQPAVARVSMEGGECNITNIRMKVFVLMDQIPLAPGFLDLIIITVHLDFDTGLMFRVSNIMTKSMLACHLIWRQTSSSRVN